MTSGDAGSRKSVLLDVSGLKKYFPIRRGLLQKTVGHVKAVDDVTFFLNRGETLSLVGESGCGKTTTARCILRAITPDRRPGSPLRTTVKCWTWQPSRRAGCGRFGGRCR